MTSEHRGPMEFVNNDGGYRSWLRAHPRGFVLNSYRHPTNRYLMLHAADCYTINGVPSRGSRWTADYIKVCADDRSALNRWIIDRVPDGHPTECQICLA